jgi:hypothetical protein
MARPHLLIATRPCRSIELKVPKKEAKPIPLSTSSTDKEQLRFKQKRNDAWLRENLGRFPGTHRPALLLAS